VKVLKVTRISCDQTLQKQGLCRKTDVYRICVQENGLCISQACGTASTTISDVHLLEKVQDNGNQLWWYDGDFFRLYTQPDLVLEIDANQQTSGQLIKLARKRAGLQQEPQQWYYDEVANRIRLQYDVGKMMAVAGDIVPNSSIILKECSSAADDALVPQLMLERVPPCELQRVSETLSSEPLPQDYQS